MKNHKKGVWLGLQDKNDSSALAESAKQEFVEMPIIEGLSDEKTVNELGSNRRDFLKYLGFGLGAATVAACDAPIRRAIPYVNKPDSIVPGVASYYASSYVSGGDYCPILVKTREGRPIKIEGNGLSKITNGGTSARAQAAVISLYDKNRFKSCGTNSIDDGFTKSSWADIDKTVMGKLNGSAQIRIVTNTVLSPTTKKVFAEFTQKYPNARVVTYDPVSSSAMLEANEQCFGEKVIPSYDFGKAKVIVSFGADFLGTWISPVEYAKGYAKNRVINKVNAKMSRHIQVDSGITMTGSNADNRILVKPSEQGAAIATLLSALGGGGGGAKVNGTASAALQKVAKELQANRGNCLVVSGSNNVGEQILVNKINDILGNYGSTIDFGNASLQRQGIDAEVQGLIREMNGGNVDVLIVLGNANPAFDLPNSDQFAAGMAKVGTKVTTALSLNETGALCNIIAPAHHLLESWGDVEAKRGHYGLIQPTIAPLFDTRQAEESLLRWSNSANLDTKSEQPYYDYLKSAWETGMFSQQSNYATFQSFWDNALHDGLFTVAQAPRAVSFAGDVSAAVGKINRPSNSELEISFYESIGVGAGQHAENPWLQEMPDPVTRCAWGNYLSVPIEWDGGNFKGFKNVGSNTGQGSADRMDLTINDVKSEVVAIPQFGQMPGTLAMGLGYGRTVASKAAKNLGNNTFPWLSIDANGNTKYYADNVQVSEVLGYEDNFACVQYHHTMGVTGTEEGNAEKINVDEKVLGFQGALTDRSVVYTTSLKDLKGELEKVGKKREFAQHLNEQTLYPYDEYKEEFYSQGHHWGLYVDINACTGCAACTVACMAENNIPVVGKYEVNRHHEMSWLRIDRYYYGDVHNPSVMYQPMMCQHCDNAPCENVCPVTATNHSSEGLNQMTYNRCIGTRYCANNCPYKVRRFNWMDYMSADLFPENEVNMNRGRSGQEYDAYMTDNLTRMVLNPDVTVRSRGVIEKCSFCVQRIQEGKLTAKKENRKLKDTDVVSACQAACPTGAIVFGDLNDKGNEINQKLKNPLNYIALEEVNVKPSVTYTIKVNNRDESFDV